MQNELFFERCRHNLAYVIPLPPSTCGLSAWYEAQLEDVPRSRPADQTPFSPDNWHSLRDTIRHSFGRRESLINPKHVETVGFSPFDMTGIGKSGYLKKIKILLDLPAIPSSVPLPQKVCGHTRCSRLISAVYGYCSGKKIKTIPGFLPFKRAYLT